MKSMPFTDGVDKNALYALLEPGNTYKIKTSGTRNSLLSSRPVVREVELVSVGVDNENLADKVAKLSKKFEMDPNKDLGVPTW